MSDKVRPITETEAREIASQWHSGQWSALYSFSSSGKVSTDAITETKDTLKDARETEKSTEEYFRDIQELKSLLAYLLQFKEQTKVDEIGYAAWPGGYPLVFFHMQYGDNGGCCFCHDCALEIAKEIDAGETDGTIDYDVENGDQAYYGGVTCDGCGEYIVEASCPECMNEFKDMKDPRAVLTADNVDAAWLCRSCAAKLVTSCENGKPQAKRIPGIGIEILATKETEHGWDNGTPWYASAGTVYRYK
jgi:hypothetical protein